jgi:hypothetical protein
VSLGEAYSRGVPHSANSSNVSIIMYGSTGEQNSWYIKSLLGSYIKYSIIQINIVGYNNTRPENTTQLEPKAQIMVKV